MAVTTSFKVNICPILWICMRYEGSRLCIDFVHVIKNLIKFFNCRSPRGFPKQGFKLRTLKHFVKVVFEMLEAVTVCALRENCFYAFEDTFLAIRKECKFIFDFDGIGNMMYQDLAKVLKEPEPIFGILRVDNTKREWK